jgi:hypothetical protein
VAQHIGSELHLEAVSGQGAVRNGHYACIVDENVQRALACKFVCGEVADGGERGEIEQGHFGAYAWSLFAKPRQRSLPFS